ncbi:hypothetical protein BGY98DRAFT_435371 [Russula aff. rugulosa BPL654]|nr:hypothetical protein BGY98DRAFT_435371 [Russula aff. rugulosa BPL654]
MPNLDHRHHHSRDGHSLTAIETAAGKLFLFGGYVRDRASSDLYVISTGISLQLSYKPAERFPPHVSHIVPRSSAHPFDLWR